MTKPAGIFSPLLITLALTLAACGGGDDPAPAPPVQNVPAPPPPPGTAIGAGGGTVTGPVGTSVVIPAGALTTETRILIEQSAVGAPPLPAGFKSTGEMFAFTPHGTTFAQPASLTIPYNPALVAPGHPPELFKTNAQNQWVRVPGAVFGATTVTAPVTGFSIYHTGDPLTESRPTYRYEVFELLGDALTERSFVVGNSLQPTLEDHYDFGGAVRDAPVLALDGSVVQPSDGLATVHVGGASNGADWWVGAEAPLGNAGFPTSTIGTKITFKQTQAFSKRDQDATLSFWVLAATMEVLDENLVLGRGCPTVHTNGFNCDAIGAKLEFKAQAFTVPFDAEDLDDVETFYTLEGEASLSGIAGTWDSKASTSSASHKKLWDIGDFLFDIETLNAHEEALVTMKLAHPIFHEYFIDLSSIAVGQPFFVQFDAAAIAYNRAAVGINGIGAEFPTGAHAYLRDPRDPLGIAVNATGLDAIEVPEGLEAPPELPVLPAACPSPKPLAGALQFDATSYRQSESNAAATITVIRTGGTQGSVTVNFATSDGSAIAGTDYVTRTTTVRFADGDDTPRTVMVNAIQNSTFGEPDKTVNISLGEPGNCASLGNPTSAVLTIQDDDPIPPPPSFNVGGTVTGLEGTGLVLDDLHFLPITPVNGPFTMRAQTQQGRPYDVHVVTQPTNPVQVCTVSNGSGTMGNADVTGVLVSCVTTNAIGGLDASFGGTGKVSSAFGGDETAMVLQPDGKIVMAGGSGDFQLARYNADGTLDQSFGTGGLVLTDIAGGSDRALALALQSDGKIVAAGYARVGNNDDFAVVRYLANGTPDPSFGTLGEVTTDFFAKSNRANAVVIAPDNQIIVAGETQLPVSGGDFALVRYSAAGVLDTTFGGTTDGKVTTDIVGGTDIAQNMVIESGGTILVTGTITLANAPFLENLGAARYSPNGVLDTSLDNDGRLSINLRSVGEGLALQPDGKLLVAGSATVAGERVFALMRLETSGATDMGFGNQGLATAAFSTHGDYGRAIALQADGRILVSGQASNESNPDFGVARFLANGQPDLSFDGDGRLTVDFFGSGDSAQNVAVQANGRIVLGGFATNGFSSRFGLARVLP